jgi:hypothetical protein
MHEVVLSLGKVLLASHIARDIARDSGYMRLVVGEKG